MINTRANVEEFAIYKGWEPLQIDGIPEGFSFTIPSITILGMQHRERYTVFIPNKDFYVIDLTPEELLTTYNKHVK